MEDKDKLKPVDDVDALAILMRLGGGLLMGELAKALLMTAEEVVATGKHGTVTLALTVSNKAQGDCMVFVDEKLSRSAPKKDPRGAMFFAVNGGLHKEDPRQLRMEFRVVDRAPGETREVDTERTERTIE